MSRICSLCGEKVGLSAYKIADGCICKSCKNYISDHIFLSEANEYYLKEMYERNKARAKKFEATTYYGNLYIDNMNNMVCYSEKGKKGTPLCFGDIYHITEFREIGLFCTNPKNLGRESLRIVCDVKFKVVTKDISAEYLVAHNRPCKVQKIDKDEVKFEFPAEVLMIKNVLMQMTDNTFFEMKRKIEDIQRMKEFVTSATLEKEWARGILFLDNIDCTPEEIKSQYKKLSKMFHPDVNPEFSDEYMKKINDAYSILQKNT